MKYEVPEINISKFSVENIVTESAVGQANVALNAAYDAVVGDSGANKAIVRTTIDQWITSSN